MHRLKHHAIALILVFSFAVQLEAVTVNPLAPMCPTNKVAPRRKRFDKISPRTFGEFYTLLTPNSPSSLQEIPQNDVPDDCGEIEDYDENDISSVTPQALRRQGYQRHRFQGGTHQLLTQHQYQGIKPSSKPTRPPPAGYFGTNSYTPPKPQEPTDNVKPVNEAGQIPHTIYRPGIVGAPIGHVAGFPQKQGSRPTPVSTSSNREPKYINHGYASTAIQHKNTHDRPRKYNSDTGIVRSFVDLFF